ncbi:MAG: BLUF domain-containing protein [Methylophilaceae bacterium]|nr:BLUF domain-containing protein [Methylophilaceae bacterium]
MSLCSLVYVSSARQDLSESMLKNMLGQWRESNEQSEITGMLLYRDGFFMQAIEGEEEKVDHLFDHISMDTRHEDIVVVYKKPIKQRGFQNRPMGLDKIDDAGHDCVDGIGEDNRFSKPAFLVHPVSQSEAMLADFRVELFF